MAMAANKLPFPRNLEFPGIWAVTANHPGCNGQDGFPHYRLFQCAAVPDPAAENAARMWARDTYGAAGMTVRVEYHPFVVNPRFPKVP